MEKNKMSGIIKITAKDEITIEHIDFNQNAYKVNREIVKTIGNGCEYYENIPAYPLYKLMGDNDISQYPHAKKNIGITILADEEGNLKENIINTLGSIIFAEYLGNTDYLVGDILLVGTVRKFDAFDFCELPDDLLNKTLDCIKALKENLYAIPHKCYACTKLNINNGNTIPVICPLRKCPCILLTSIPPFIDSTTRINLDDARINQAHKLMFCMGFNKEIARGNKEIYTYNRY